jgi:tetratricopeptide (TPR) repeat protein
MVCGQSSWAHRDVDIDAISEEIRKNPNRTDLVIKRAQLWRLNGEHDKALADLDRTARKESDNPRLLLERALTLSAMGHNQEAEGQLEYLLERFPKARAVVLAELGSIRARTGRKRAAIADLSESIKIEPTLDLYLARGRLQRSERQLADAAAGYRQGLAKLGSDTVLLADELYEVEMARVRYAEALKLADQQLQKTPAKTKWLLRRAEALSATGQSAKAEKARQRALDEADRILGKRPTPLNQLQRAKVFFAMGRMEEASCDLDAVIRRAPRIKQAKELRQTILAQGVLGCPN